MSKTVIALIILAIIIVGFIGWQLSLPFNQQIFHYKQLYDKMSETEYLQGLRDFCRYNLSNSIDGLNYSQLITWEHKYLTYTQNDFTRREMPIAILNSYITDGIAFGRCGEFALLYTGLCLANDIPVRLILDESSWTNKSKTGGAGDHVWNQIYENDRWITVDPTENRINDPKMYVRDWNKEVNNVVAIWKDASGNMVVVDVTKTYE
jgi:hypothetical protein